MDIPIKLNLRKDAQTRLVRNPQDPIHDITHHYRTWLIAQQLVQEEGLFDQIDLDLLELVCWWHDVLIIEEPLQEDERVVDVTARYVKRNFPAEVSDEAESAIQTHEFGTTPENLIGRILQDSDKLEIISEERINDAVEAVQAGIWDKHYALEMLESIKNNWLPQMIEKYHFEFSRKYHEKRLDKFLQFLEKAKKKLEL